MDIRTTSRTLTFTAIPQALLVLCRPEQGYALGVALGVRFGLSGLRMACRVQPNVGPRVVLYQLQAQGFITVEGESDGLMLRTLRDLLRGLAAVEEGHLPRLVSGDFDAREAATLAACRKLDAHRRSPLESPTLDAIRRRNAAPPLAPHAQNLLEHLNAQAAAARALRETLMRYANARGANGRRLFAPLGQED